MALTIDLTGTKALVSGVTSGIGAGIARLLTKAGCDVAGCGQGAVTEPGAQAFLNQARAQGRRACYAEYDLIKTDAPGKWVDEAALALGGIDLLVSNAGRNVFAGAAGCDDKTWQACLDLNLAAHWRLAKSARPFLEQSRRPVIIVIASNHAWQSLPGCFPYNVSKAGLVALVQSLAIEWGPRIRAVGIAPGFIDTPANDLWFRSFPDPAAARARTEKMHPVGRLGTADEIGALCAFLASPGANFISGTTLLVDGGMGALMQRANGWDKP
ncbi:MAG: SDR family oxidoreductase [Verrucomicrobia bacterium]|nr:SDR family oxidoreductase [Verrucomicrobiota bacterium]